MVALASSASTHALSNRLFVDVQSAQALKAQAAQNDPEALKAAAKQFEAMVVQMMLKTMRETKFTQEGDVFGDSNSLKMYQDLLDQQWAQKIADGKGLGFADAMVKAMVSRSTVLSEEEMKLLAQRDPSGGNASKGSTQIDELLSLPAAKPETKVQVPAVSNAPGSSNQDPRQRFLDEVRPHAEKIAVRLGVSVDMVLGHAALETGWGKRQIQGADGQNSFNLFGIKAGSGWSGKSVEIATTEYRQGVPMKMVDRFRAYADYSEALSDYATLLGRRYPQALNVGSDGGAFASALAEGGYATDPHYAAKLAGTISALAKRTS